MQRIDTEERRRRIGVRQHLAPPCRAADVESVARDLVGIHATDPASVYLGAHARMTGLTRERMAAALYDDRSILKILGMRRTMFVVPLDVAGTIISAVTSAIGRNERKRTLQLLDQAGVAPDVHSWLADVEAQTVAALEEMGEATAAQLARRVPGLRVQLSFGEGRRWAGKVGVSTRLLFLLAAEARIIRGRPRGTWLSSMYAWAPMSSWVAGDLTDRPMEEAQAELVRFWLRTYGPGTMRDVQWWTGLSVAATRRALAAAGAIEVALDGRTGYVLPGDDAPTPRPDPWATLVPALDSTTMAWKERAWYLGDHGPRLFDSNGNAGPAVWVDGQIVGGWGVRAGGEIAVRVLQDVGREAQQAIEEEAERISRFIGESRVLPRFRTSLELELSAS